jgi:hypothetical protein
MTGYKQFRDRLERLEQHAERQARRWRIRRIIITADHKQVEVIERSGGTAILLVGVKNPPDHPANSEANGSRPVAADPGSQV